MLVHVESEYNKIKYKGAVVRGGMASTLDDKIFPGGFELVILKDSDSKADGTRFT